MGLAGFSIHSWGSRGWLLPRGVDSTVSETLDEEEIYRMSRHALCWKLCSAIPRSSPEEYDQGDLLFSGCRTNAGRHKVNFSATTRKRIPKCALKLSTGMKNKTAKQCRMHKISCSRAGVYQTVLFSSKGVIRYPPLQPPRCCVLEMLHTGLIYGQSLVSLIVEKLHVEASAIHVLGFLWSKLCFYSFTFGLFSIFKLFRRNLSALAHIWLFVGMGRKIRPNFEPRWMNYILNPQSIYNETGPVDHNLDVGWIKMHSLKTARPMQVKYSYHTHLFQFQCCFSSGCFLHCTSNNFQWQVKLCIIHRHSPVFTKLHIIDVVLSLWVTTFNPQESSF